MMTLKSDLDLNVQHLVIRNLSSNRRPSPRIGITMSAGIWGYVLQHVPSKVLLSAGAVLGGVQDGNSIFSSLGAPKFQMDPHGGPVDYM